MWWSHCEIRNALSDAMKSPCIKDCWTSTTGASWLGNDWTVKEQVETLYIHYGRNNSTVPKV